MNLSFKDMKFIIEAVDNLIEKYQTRINQIEDLDEYEDEISDLGNDTALLGVMRYNNPTPNPLPASDEGAMMYFITKESAV